uniref:Uncharacterized protein n=1 Tax=Oryza sativa subsp. japonica TaxID=39947 RepID=Q7XIT2_ORYSJ|nr:hypothetical protein [Oryza sativa Japonica Group]
MGKMVRRGNLVAANAGLADLLAIWEASSHCDVSIYGGIERQSVSHSQPEARKGPVTEADGSKRRCSVHRPV